MTFVAITSYFNPCGYRSKEANYNIFRQALERHGVKVLCVEQGFDAVPRVGNQSDLYIRGGEILWQKECLLQIGIDHCLSASDENIVLIDCDLIFESESFLETIDAAFGRFDCFQPFESISLNYSDAHIVMPSVASLRSTGFSFGKAHPGGAFAGTSKFFRQVKLYRYALLGGGDMVLSYLLLLASSVGLGSPKVSALIEFCVTKRLFPALRESALSWVESASANGWSFGNTPGVRVRSLSHGALSQRQYDRRYEIWSRVGPMPGIHFNVGAKQLLEWMPDSSCTWRQAALHYFASRNEDQKEK